MRWITALLLVLMAPMTAADDRAVAVEYIKARCATLSKGATSADVDRVVALFSDDAVIEHPAFNAVVRGKEAIRRGMVSHLEDYTGTRQDSGIIVLDSVESPGAVAFKTNTTFVVGDGASRKVITREGLTIVEVRGSHISRLIEY